MPQKIALITGANRGLGRSMAIHLATAGVGIIGTYRTHKEEAHAVEAEITEAGGRAVLLPLNVSHSDEFPHFKETVTEVLASTFGSDHFDFLVNNAGVGIQASFAATTEGQFDELVSVHLKAPFFLTQILLPLIADDGRVLHVSSGTARHVVPGYAAYGPMKAAVEVLTMYMAKELGQRGIRVNVIAPGAVATDFSGGLLRDEPEIQKYVAGTVALGRVGQPDDIGTAVVSILSDNFGWVNGARIDLSGGQAL